MGNTAMKKMMNGIKRVFSNSRGGAMLAVLIIVPVIVAMGLAMHYVAGNQAGATMSRAADSEAMYAAEGAAEKYLADITSDSAKMTAFINAKEGDYVSRPLELQGIGADSSRYRYPFKIIYAITKVANAGANPLTNTMTFKAEAQVFNNTTSPSWGSGYNAHAAVYQEIDRGAGVLKSCAANYDVWAGHDINEKALFSFDFFSNGAYYAGNQYDACGGFNFSFGSQKCVDVSKNSPAAPRAQATFIMFCSSQCSKNGFTCNAAPLTFGGAIGNWGRDGVQNTGDDINWLNVCGDSAHCGYPTGGYAAGDLPYDKSYAYWMEKMVKLCPGDPGTCNWTGTFLLDKKLHYPDANKDGIPDAPYFFYDGDFNGIFPFKVGAFRSKTVYLYVNGDIRSLSMDNMGAFNAGRLVVIAKKGVMGLSMMSSSMLSSGVEVIAGQDYLSGTIMNISGFADGTILANHDITIDSMMNMNLGQSMHLVAGHDVNENSFMGSSGFFNIGSHGQCGADCKVINIETSVGRGRRYI